MKKIVKLLIILKIKSKFSKYNQSYYAKDNPTISDAEYDIIKKIIGIRKNIHTLKKLPQ